MYSAPSFPFLVRATDGCHLRRMPCCGLPQRCAMRNDPLRHKLRCLELPQHRPPLAFQCSACGLWSRTKWPWRPGPALSPWTLAMRNRIVVGVERAAVPRARRGCYESATSPGTSRPSAGRYQRTAWIIERQRNARGHIPQFVPSDAFWRRLGSGGRATCSPAPMATRRTSKVRPSRDNRNARKPRVVDGEVGDIDADPRGERGPHNSDEIAWILGPLRRRKRRERSRWGEVGTKLQSWSARTRSWR